MPLDDSAAERFDPMMLQMAQQVAAMADGENPIELLLDLYFGFLRRKTDFFDAPERCKDAVLAAYQRQADVVAAASASKQAKAAKQAAAAAAEAAARQKREAAEDAAGEVLQESMHAEGVDEFGDAAEEDISAIRSFTGQAPDVCAPAADMAQKRGGGAGGAGGAPARAQRALCCRADGWQRCVGRPPLTERALAALIDRAASRLAHTLSKYVSPSVGTKCGSRPYSICRAAPDGVVMLWHGQIRLLVR